MVGLSRSEAHPDPGSFMGTLVHLKRTSVHFQVNQRADVSEPVGTTDMLYLGTCLFFSFRNRLVALTPMEG